MSTLPAPVTAGGERIGVYEAIRRVQADLSRDGISKSRKNQQQGYSFRGVDDIYNALASSLAAHGLCIIPRYGTRECVERTSKDNRPLFNVVIDAEFDLVGMDGSKHTARTFGEAMDSADKATNKAMSAAYKYMCLQVFCIPTEADNDADATTHAVANRRIAELKAKATEPQSGPEYQAWANIEPEPPADAPKDGGYEARQTAKDAEAQAVAGAGEPKKSAPKLVSGKMLQEFGQIKELLRNESDGTDTLYYSILDQFGYRKSNEIPTMNDGRVVYKSMQAAHLKLKTKQANREEIEDIARRLGPERFWRICGADLSIDAEMLETADEAMQLRILARLREEK